MHGTTGLEIALEKGLEEKEDPESEKEDPEREKEDPESNLALPPSSDPRADPLPHPPREEDSTHDLQTDSKPPSPSLARRRKRKEKDRGGEGGETSQPPESTTMTTTTVLCIDTDKSTRDPGPLRHLEEALPRGGVEDEH